MTSNMCSILQDIENRLEFLLHLIIFHRLDENLSFNFQETLNI